MSQLEPLLRAAERRAVLSVLRAHPEWTLAHLATLLEHDGARAPVLRELTVGELLDEPTPTAVLLAEDGGPAIDPERLAAAQQRCGAQFDRCVRQALDEAPYPVGAGYLRARVGGPRWKLLASLRRLIAAGLVQRDGATCSTRYWSRAE
jgi:hypothetical protein